MKPWLAAMLALVLAFGAGAGAAGAARAACSPGSVELRGDWGTARFSVEVADAPDEWQRGLMNRAHLATSAGMLFVYPWPQTVKFWMRNTLIPLDMIFAGADGVVRRVHENAVPKDETSIFGGNDIQYVLEINGGLARRLGIGPGTQLRHPAIDRSVAAWPCD